MIDKVKARIIEKVQKLTSDKYDCDDLRIFFIDLRDSLDTMNYDRRDFLYDIFNFYCHPNARDQGEVFRYSRDNAREIINIFKNGGDTSNYGITDISLLTALSTMLTLLDIPYTEDALKAQNNKIKECIFDFIDNTPIMVKDVDIDSCKITFDANLKAPMISIKTKPWNSFNKENNLTSINGGMTINFRLV